MIEFELAEELYLLGWPQVRGKGSYASKQDNDGNSTNYVAPSLSELIAACGTHLYKLTHFVGHDYAWEAENFHNRRRAGKSPEEAVARLWLTLQDATERKGG